MRKSNLISLGDALKQMLKEEKLEQKISWHVVRNSWEEIAGTSIARHTTELAFRENVMFLSLDSSVLRNELMYQRQDIIDKVNRFCGYRLIQEVVLK